jgi:CysZ protein
MKGSPEQALQYFVEGAKIIFNPGFRRFIFIPLCVNLLIFVGLTFAFYYKFKDFIDYVLEALPFWLDWLIWLIWPLAVFLFLMAYGYSFNIITNIIAAPFYGLLAEKIETHITGNTLPEEPWGQLIPRTFQRELVKLFYFVTRGILILILVIGCFFIPGLNFLVVILGGIWSCWCMAAQYSDYPADNHQLSFQELRNRLNQIPLTSYSYGGIILLGSMVPVLNIIVTPIGVAGATVMWVKELRFLEKPPANHQ